MMRAWGRKTLWDSGVWRLFEYFHPVWLRFKYIGDVDLSGKELEMNKAKGILL